VSGYSFSSGTVRGSAVLRLMRGVLALAAMLSSTAVLAIPIDTVLSTPIDMNLLFHEPGAPIGIAADGSSATLAEDPNVFAVFLSNVPDFGDPRLLTAAAGARLAFDYDFAEAPDNTDIFHFALLDGELGHALDLFSLFVTQSGSGSASFDLSALVGTSLGLQFELVPDPQADHGFDSLLTISQLRVETPVIAVTEPGALALLALGLTAVMMLRRRRASIGYVCA
jgi:hypothetical protein